MYLLKKNDHFLSRNKIPRKDPEVDRKRNALSLASLHRVASSCHSRLFCSRVSKSSSLRGTLISDPISKGMAGCWILVIISYIAKVVKDEDPVWYKRYKCGKRGVRLRNAGCVLFSIVFRARKYVRRMYSRWNVHIRRAVHGARVQSERQLRHPHAHTTHPPWNSRRPARVVEFFLIPL